MVRYMAYMALYACMKPRPCASCSRTRVPGHSDVESASGTELAGRGKRNLHPDVQYVAQAGASKMFTGWSDLI